MLIMINFGCFSWDKIFKDYKLAIKLDKFGDFAYERRVNIPSILSLCPEDADHVLDLGCGDGRFTKILSNSYKYVYGVDESELMISNAKKLIPSGKFTKLNLEKEFPQYGVKFDLIVAKLLLMYINNLDFFAENCFKLLAPKGSLVVSLTHPIKWASELDNYFIETNFESEIANNKDLKLMFKSRTIQTYINTFTKHGFLVNALLELGVPDTFVLKYPKYINNQNVPKRLNIQFVKP